MTRIKKTIVGVAIGISALAIAVPGALAARPHHGPRPFPVHFGADAVAYGTVASGDMTGFTVNTTGGGSYAVATTPRTRFVAVNPSDGATFQAGDAVLTRGFFVNGFTARVVWFDSAPFNLVGSGHWFAGTGDSNDATSLSLTDKSNAVDSFTLDSKTRFWVNGNRTDPSAVPSVTGDHVAVFAVERTDGSWLARGVWIRLPKPKR